MLNSALRIIKATDQEAWMNVLSRVQGYDFYHLPDYHCLAAEQGEGEGVLLTYTEGSDTIALPLLLRPIEVTNERSLGGYQDATSVYGYAGPVATPKALADAEFLNRFGDALRSEALQLRIVSVFSRLHPVLGNHQLLAGLGDTIPLGPTVSIDLTISDERQVAAYRKSHRYEIRRARAQGVQVRQAGDGSALDAFQCLYCATMERVQAADRYFFDAEYFRRLSNLRGSSVRVFLAERDGELCAAALFMHTGDIVQYHLSASDARYAKLAPTKLVIDEARVWATGVGAKYLHLGGGVGAQEDQLYQMKSGFSELRQRFYVWNWIVNPEIYRQLVEARQFCDDGAKAVGGHTSGFFPLYRR